MKRAALWTAAAKPPLCESGGWRHRSPEAARCAAFLVALFVATSALAQMQRVAEDAIVIDRVAEASKRDLPADLLKRIVAEDIDLLRGKRADGTFEFASYERLEAGRQTQEFSIQPSKEKMATVEIRGAFAYRVIVEVPKRRLVVGRNRPVWLERVDVEYLGTGSAQVQTTTLEVKAWLQPGEVRPVDLPVIGRQVTARVIATADQNHGYGNIEVTLVQARIVDNPDSPYADAVGSAKAIQRALETNDVKSIRAMAQRMRASLGGGVAPRVVSTPTPAASSIDVRPSTDTATQLELQAELQVIEDLLTGTETERREGLDRLHQMIRRLRR
jgi:hypothetical protein